MRRHKTISPAAHAARVADIMTRDVHTFRADATVASVMAVLAGMWRGAWQVSRGPEFQLLYILIAVFLFTIGFNMILLGLLAELMIRTYHESQAKPVYLVRERRNVGDLPPAA